MRGPVRRQLPVRHAVRATLVVVLATSLAACGRGDGTRPADTSTTSTRQPASSLAGAIGALEWSSCEAIECSSLVVPVDHTQPAGGSVQLPVFARASASGSTDDLLVLVGDRTTGSSARALVDEAPLRLGAMVGNYTVVSLGVRGSAEAPLPPDGLIHGGTIDAVDDLEMLIRTMGVSGVRVIGWGNGATIAATWVMLHPESVAAAVLDTPDDPSASYLRQEVERIVALNDGVEATMRWCASHLSCPLNQETRQRWVTMLDMIDAGIAPATLTRDLVNQAGWAAMLTDRASELFRAVDEAMDDQPARLIALASSVPEPASARWRCADYRGSAARRLVREWSRPTWRWLVPGAHLQLFEQCATGAEPGRPLGTIAPVPAAVGARVMVTLARFDPAGSVDAPRAMAKKMKWTYRSVRMARHHVIGHDRFITARALEFLAG